jgi:hypothetical protein
VRPLHLRQQESEQTQTDIVKQGIALRYALEAAMQVPLSVKRYFLVLSICLTAIFLTLIIVQSPVIFQGNQYFAMQGAVVNEIKSKFSHI